MIQEQLPEYANAKLCSGNARRAPGTERALKVILQTSRESWGVPGDPGPKQVPSGALTVLMSAESSRRFSPDMVALQIPLGKPLSKAARVSECQNSGHDWARCNSIQDQGSGVFQNQSLN